MTLQSKNKRYHSISLQDLKITSMLTTSASLPDQNICELSTSTSLPDQNICELSTSASLPDQNIYELSTSASLPDQNICELSTSTSLPDQNICELSNVNCNNASGKLLIGVTQMVSESPTIRTFLSTKKNAQ